MTKAKTPTSLPVPPLPSPPVTSGQRWYQSAAFWTWLFTQLISIAGFVGVLVGHPFNSTPITAAASSVAFLIAGVTTVIFVHGQQVITAAKVHARGSFAIALIGQGGQSVAAHEIIAKL